MIESVASEFEGSSLGDPRRQRRLEQIANAVAQEPEAGLPMAMQGEAELEGLYRFLNNEHVDAQQISAAHFAKTLGRCGLESLVVAHDTTEFDFTSRDEIEGLGRLTSTKTQGFFAHVALAIGSLEQRNPLGLLHLQPWHRLDAPHATVKKETRVAKDSNERDRWWQAVDAVAQRLGAHDQQAIHVMDREADSYEIAHTLARKGHRFVIRAAHKNRKLAIGDARDTQPLHQVVREGARGICQREVSLSRRVQKNRSQDKIHPSRASRKAVLSFSAMQVTLASGEWVRGQGLSPKLSVNVVHVIEQDAPSACAPVEWYLLTREPIDSEEEVLHIVDAYRARWLIEEFFKALKTGCAFEKRQLKSAHALQVALSIYSVVAWNLLRLRALSQSKTPANEVLRPTQIAVLNAAMKLRKQPPLTQGATVEAAMIAIAKLGGYIKHNGLPGWIVLGRGYQDLLMMEIGWVMRGVG